MLRRILLALAAALSLSLTAVADGESLATLVGTSWRLTQLDDESVAPAVTATLVISADSIGGNGGCNTYGGNIAATPTGIDITEVFSTLMACDNLEQEQAFLAALEAADAFAMAAGNLQLLENGTVLAELAPANQ
ncbi:META domain-containing protein [Devosia sp.]|uniref:META domain-containing protein n=1 Tax=Devosia sp. TaxID=1871048 RepID=UPI0019DDC819|nr:META domain-containing protein [Devosia sp.]MBE0580575.1 META domain-containing protein [Devosia sp.]